MRRSLLTFALLALCASYLPAQEPGRELNGFEFIPSRIVADPFAITYFGTITGGGMAFDLKTPFVDLDGDTIGTLTGDVAFMALGFEYQQRSASGWPCASRSRAAVESGRTSSRCWPRG